MFHKEINICKYVYLYNDVLCIYCMYMYETTLEPQVWIYDKPNSSHYCGLWACETITRIPYKLYACIYLFSSVFCYVTVMSLYPWLLLHFDVTRQCLLEDLHYWWKFATLFMFQKEKHKWRRQDKNCNHMQCFIAWKLYISHKMFSF